MGYAISELTVSGKRRLHRHEPHPGLFAIATATEARHYNRAIRAAEGYQNSALMAIPYLGAV
jgi:hypothetical protein